MNMKVQFRLGPPRREFMVTGLAIIPQIMETQMENDMEAGSHKSLLRLHVHTRVIHENPVRFVSF